MDHIVTEALAALRSSLTQEYLGKVHARDDKPIPTPTVEDVKWAWEAGQKMGEINQLLKEGVIR